ncbi:MAG: hypothetical protein R3E99_06845 [Burkholderiaceae bacterium]
MPNAHKITPQEALQRTIDLAAWLAGWASRRVGAVRAPSSTAKSFTTRCCT